MRRRLIALVSFFAVLVGVATITLAAPGTEQCFAQAATEADVEGRVSCPGSPGPPTPGVASGVLTISGSPGATPPGAQPVCALSTRLRAVAATRRAGGVRFAFSRRTPAPVTVDVFRVSQGRVILGNRRVVRFAGRTSAFSWPGRGAAVGDGSYVARYRATGAGTRRLALRRRDGRFTRRPDFEADDGCGLVRSFKLERPVFGGRGSRALGISYRITRAARVTVTVTRAGRTVRRFPTTSDKPGRSYRLRLPSERLARGDHRIRISVRAPGEAEASSRLTAARL